MFFSKNKRSVIFEEFLKLTRFAFSFVLLFFVIGQGNLQHPFNQSDAKLTQAHLDQFHFSVPQERGKFSRLVLIGSRKCFSYL